MNTEFDDLLEAFLNDELETKTKNADDNMVEEPLYEIMPALEPYISRGTTYYVPAACNKPQFYFRRFSLLVDSEELSSEGEQKSLIMWDVTDDNYRLGMYLEDVFLKYEGLSCPDDVSILLYRVGNSNPLKVYTKQMEGAEKMLVGDFSEIEGGWMPGEYFVLVTNAVCTEDASESNWDTFHSHMRYSFRILSPDDCWNILPSGNFHCPLTKTWRCI